MKINKPSTDYIYIWRLRATILLIAISFFCGFLYVFVPILTLIIAIISILLYPLYMFIYIPKLYKNYSYTISNDYITIKKGFLFFKHIKLDFNKVQLIQQIQSPMQRHKKLYSVNLYTAGTRVFIDCISKSDVEEIKSLQRKQPN